MRSSGTLAIPSMKPLNSMEEGSSSKGIQELLCPNCGTWSTTSSSCSSCDIDFAKHMPQKFRNESGEIGMYIHVLPVTCRPSYRKNQNVPLSILTKRQSANLPLGVVSQAGIKQDASCSSTGIGIKLAIDSEGTDVTTPNCKLSPDQFYGRKCARQSAPCISTLDSVVNIKRKCIPMDQKQSRKKRPASFNKAEPVVISIDSDGDNGDPGNSSGQTSRVAQKETTCITVYSSSQDDVYTSQRPDQVAAKKRVSRKVHMRDKMGNIIKEYQKDEHRPHSRQPRHEDSDSSDHGEANGLNPDDQMLVLQAIMLRFGSLGIENPSTVEFRSDGFFFHLPTIYPQSEIYLDTKSLESCQYCLSYGMPTIVLETTPYFASLVRERLRMEKGEAFFDPGSKVVAERRIIFRPRQDRLPRSAVHSLECMFHQIAVAKGINKEKLFIKRPKETINKLLGQCRPPQDNLDQEYLQRIAPQQCVTSKQYPLKQLESTDNQRKFAAEDNAAGRNSTSRSTCDHPEVSLVVKNKVQEAAIAVAATAKVTGSDTSTGTHVHQPEVILVYPPAPVKGRINVHKVDMGCLEEGEFLNDVIIDFYIKYVVYEILSESQRQKTFIFSSFFYGRLMRREYSHDKEHTRMEKRHHKVRTWTRNMDIFQKDFIIVPINEHCHWYVAIICFPGLVGEPEYLKDCDASPHSTVSGISLRDDNKESGEEETEVDDNQFQSNKKKHHVGDGSRATNQSNPTASPHHPKHAAEILDNRCHQTLEAEDALFAQYQKRHYKRPCILIFDSLGGPARRHVIQNLREYLTVEWQAKRNSKQVFDAKTMKGCQPKVPQQNNFSDCGVYLLQYVQMFFQKPINDFTLPIKGLDAWFTDAAVSKKRREIRDLIYELRRRSKLLTADYNTTANMEY